jgi:hypothetical protein
MKFHDTTPYAAPIKERHMEPAISVAAYCGPSLDVWRLNNLSTARPIVYEYSKPNFLSHLRCLVNNQ